MKAEVSPHFRAWINENRTEFRALKVRNTQTQGKALCQNRQPKPQPCIICLPNRPPIHKKNMPPIQGSERSGIPISMGYTHR